MNACPEISNCTIFNLLQSRSKFLWMKNYCHCAHLNCSRVKILKNKQMPPMNMLPNGSLHSFDQSK